MPSVAILSSLSLPTRVITLQDPKQLPKALNLTRIEHKSGALSYAQNATKKKLAAPFVRNLKQLTSSLVPPATSLLPCHHAAVPLPTNLTSPEASPVLEISSSTLHAP